MALLLWVITAWAQGRTIAGVVLNATDNEPIIGASVPVKDTQLGASSNIDGELSINLTQKATAHSKKPVFRLKILTFAKNSLQWKRTRT